MNEAQIRRELRLLKAYALIMTAMFATLTLTAFRRSAHEKFTEIDVERINVVEPDGKYRFVISNKPRSIGPLFKGRPFGYPGGGRPGIIFFNDEGTENGGLSLGGSRAADGSVDASSHMSFDQFDNDQVLNLDYRERNGQRLVGISMLDRAPIPIERLTEMYDSLNRIADPAGRRAEMIKIMTPTNGEPLQAQRVFLGRNPQKAAMLLLSDPKGRPRIRIAVDSTGSPAIEFLDESGKVSTRMPEGRK
jgi:hypothetical protein